MPARILIAYALIGLFVVIGAFAVWRLSRGARHRPMAERWLPSRQPRPPVSHSISAMADQPADTGPNTQKD